MGKQGVSKLTVNESSGDFTHVLVLDAADIVAAGTDAIEFATIPAGGGLDVAVAYAATDITGGTNVVLNVGTTVGDPDEFLDAADIDATNALVANTGESLVQSSGDTTIAGGSLPVGLATSDTKVYYKFGGTVSTITAGKIIIGLRIFDLGRFA